MTNTNSKDSKEEPVIKYESIQIIKMPPMLKDCISKNERNNQKNKK